MPKDVKKTCRIPGSVLRRIASCLRRGGFANLRAAGLLINQTVLDAPWGAKALKSIHKGLRGEFAQHRLALARRVAVLGMKEARLADKKGMSLRSVEALLALGPRTPRNRSAPPKEVLEVRWDLLQEYPRSGSPADLDQWRAEVRSARFKLRSEMSPEEKRKQLADTRRFVATRLTRAADRLEEDLDLFPRDYRGKVLELILQGRQLTEDVERELTKAIRT